ncbi:MAG TPA: PKD domain containing protein, partial [Algoriphagus sp.]|nr:PKD domain containing protein [Algoriphagus sp.]
NLEFEELAPGCPGGLDGALEVKVSGGTPPYTYQWENGEALALLENLPSGEFSVTVTDSQGCQISGLGKVSESRPQVRMPTGFSPKDGPYQPISNCSISYKLMIFNRWGQLIFSGTEGWDGNHNANPMPPGAYSYYISYQYSLENGLNTDEKRGTFTLIN